jgi:hypothetical protein
LALEDSVKLSELVVRSIDEHFVQSFEERYHTREYEFSVHPKFLPKHAVHSFRHPKTIVF